jgi:hypothetical protein
MSHQFLTQLLKQHENAVSVDTKYLMKFGKRRQINLEAILLVDFSAAR